MPARRATASTRCCGEQHHVFRDVDTAGVRRAGQVARSGQLGERRIRPGPPRGLRRPTSPSLSSTPGRRRRSRDRSRRSSRPLRRRRRSQQSDLMKDQGNYKKFDDSWRGSQVPRLRADPGISAGTASDGEGLETINKVAQSRLQSRPDRRAQSVPEQACPHTRPVTPKKHVRILTPRRPASPPPTFVCFTNVATEFHSPTAISSRTSRASPSA